MPCLTWLTLVITISGFTKERKGKKEYLYSAILADTTLTKRSDSVIQQEK